jgi:hypothetical protein
MSALAILPESSASREAARYRPAAPEAVPVPPYGAWRASPWLMAQLLALSHQWEAEAARLQGQADRSKSAALDATARVLRVCAHEVQNMMLNTETIAQPYLALAYEFADAVTCEEVVLRVPGSLDQALRSEGSMQCLAMVLEKLRAMAPCANIEMIWTAKGELELTGALAVMPETTVVIIRRVTGGYAVWSAFAPDSEDGRVAGDVEMAKTAAMTLMARFLTALMSGAGLKSSG